MTCVKQSLVLKQVNSSLVVCVKICPHACIRDETTTKKHKNSRQGKIEFERLKIWSCHNFKQPDLNAKLRASTIQEHRKQVDCFSVDDYCNLCRTVLKQWVFFSFLSLSRSDTKPIWWWYKTSNQKKGIGWASKILHSRKRYFEKKVQLLSN